jgi:hypothetical protein
MDKQISNIKNILKKQNGISNIGQGRKTIIIIMPALIKTISFHS